MSARDKLDRAEDEVFWIREAVEYLSGVRGCEDVIETLHERQIILTFERDELRKIVQEQDARLDNELWKEHERDLL